MLVPHPHFIHQREQQGKTTNLPSFGTSPTQSSRIPTKYLFDNDYDMAAVLLCPTVAVKTGFNNGGNNWY
jgi:hypothetical protein